MGSLLRPGLDDERPWIVYIDAFDSFANNITGLLEQRLGARVTLVHTDNAAIDQNLLRVLAAADAVVVGPGPGHPANASDVGFIDKLWALEETQLLPVLGICLGFQSLCLAHGADVRRLQQPRHGIVTRVEHRGSDMFAGLGELDATQYHSLHADIGGGGVSWEPTRKCPLLRPLAWDEGDETNGPVLMGVRHTSKPFWGVQFHPESICTSAEGAELITNWWVQAREWLLGQGRTRTEVPDLSKWLPTAVANFGNQVPSGTFAGSDLARELRSVVGPGDVVLGWERYPATKSLTPAALLDALGYRGEEVVVLDSQGHNAGRFDIVGLIVPGQTVKVTYSVSDRVLRYGSGATPTSSTPVSSIDEVWPMLQEALDLHVPRNGLNRECPRDIPFWGGFMGYISYEAGLETIDVEQHISSGNSVPDLNFAFIHRSIVFDHETSHVYVQSLLPNDQDWILATGSTIKSLTTQEALPPVPAPLPSPPKSPLSVPATANRPSETSYRCKVGQCQTYLHSGDSYELCLTDSSTITLHTPSDPWSWYTNLRKRNPAPHGAYVHLSGVHVLSSSPERFLRWTRAGICEFRPIKGTVKKRLSSGEEVTRAEAEVILGTAKERAENLMIVDLIRHDLAGAVGADNVWVSQLMKVEEFATVWHLVSVVQGKLGVSVAGADDDEGRGSSASGIDVLRRSLPPGSMTGAPKKRSCEILNRIEGKARGVYSGVLGYMDVGGGGDFSVVIRTAVRCAGEVDVGGDELWHVGAGGAVTVQSDELGEFLEMETKAASVLDALFESVNLKDTGKVG